MKIAKSNKGLTLIEIVVSLAILGIIITPLATLFVSSVRNNVNSEDRMIANQLAQKYMEEMMNDIKPYIGTGNELRKDDGDFKTVGRTESSVDTYANSTGSMPTFDFTINASEVADDDNINVKDTKVIINSSLPNQITPDDKIDIGINCNGSSAITLNVSNESTKTVNIYKVYSSTEGKKVTINTDYGEVYTYENIYDDSIIIDNRNRVYRIKVVVAKDGESLTELVRFKTIE